MNKKNKNPTIKDVAKEAGVCFNTVSRVLNDGIYIKAETKEKVLKAIKNLNYRPNILARGLRNRRTRTIGVIVPDISIPFFSHIVLEIEKYAREKGYTIILGCTFYDKKEEEYQVKFLIDQIVEGLILFGGYDNYNLIKNIKDKNIPLVLLDRIVEDEEVLSVQIDNIKAIEAAVDYLYKFGHRNICYVQAISNEHSVLKNRFIGYQNALLKNNLNYDPNLLLSDDSFILKEGRGLYELTKKFIKEKDYLSITAFIAPGDIFSAGLVKSLKDMNFKVPKDFSIIAIGDTDINQYIDPPVTSIKIPEKLMADAAINLLIKSIKNETIKEKNIVFPTQIQLTPLQGNK
ncbi:MAG: LacI family transcriptional regulator [Actinobacteria bacterium]|nr:LacI family transcriptional regulator [Actinomycetota bacterium]